MKIVLAGFIVRYPLAGNGWHQLQYLVGLRRLGHDVVFVEHAAWAESCYDPVDDRMTADPRRGLAFLDDLLSPNDVDSRWCYIDEEGRAHGMTREELGDSCAESDLLLSIGNVNWLPEFGSCVRRAMVDIDPVFTQIGAIGVVDPQDHYNALFTFGENVHRAGCTMPTGGAHWIPTRQPVVLAYWPVTTGSSDAPMTSVINWTAYGDHIHDGQIYGQKDRQFKPFFDLPRQLKRPMELAVGGPQGVLDRLHDGGWSLADATAVTRDLPTFQGYIQRSAGEFCVAKHGYVASGSGWFSDRSTCYLASARPVVLEDTGFSCFLPCGDGLLAFRSPAEARAAIRRVDADYDYHCSVAREVAASWFGSDEVLGALLESAL